MEKRVNPGPEPERSASRRVGRFLVSLLGACVLLGAFSAGAQAITPTIVNQDSVGGQTSWLESFASGGQTDKSANDLFVTVLVKHDPGKEVTGLKIDDDWDGTEESNGEGVRSVSAQQPNLSGGYGYSRVTYKYDNFPTSGTGMSCGVFSGTRRTTKQVSMRAVLNDGSQTAATISSIKFVANGQCLGAEDYPFIFDRSQSATSIDTGQSVTFTYAGDDADTTGDDDFDGIRWRLRRVGDGTTTSPQTSCPNNGDNADKTLTVNFPNRGRWVVEAELLNNDCGSDQNNNPGYWWYIGGVDVNSSASESPHLSLSATRPQINGNTVVTATADDSSDSSQGGTVQDIEWDVDENTSNGVNGYEDVSLGDVETGLSVAQRTRTINTNGKLPGLHTVRARIGDNGAISGADNIRRTASATTTYLVDHPPVVNNQSLATETETALPINLGAVDADGDALTYSITDPPDHGSLSGGTTATPTYTSATGYAGTDSFTVQVADGFGGTDSATISVRVDPDTIIDAGPTGTVDDRGASFEFHSRATGAVFECSLDGATFSACGSPQDYTDLDDGSHQFRVRAKAAGNTDQSPATRSWAIDAFPDIVIDSGPDPETADISATFAFTASQVGATTAPDTDCKLDGGDFRPCTSPITYNDVDDGSHTFVVRATDAYGKTATAQRTWSVDAVGSNTIIDSAPPAHTSSTDATVTFSSPDVDATFQCQMDGGPWLACDSPEDFTGLTEGEHVFRARAVDAANIIDPTPAKAVWKIDLTPPDTSFTAGPGLTNDPTPTFEFDAVDELDVTFECSVDGGPFGSCSSPHTTASLSDGPHTIEARGTDEVGNEETSAASRNFTVDTTAPQTNITGGPGEGDRIASSGATLTFASPDSTATFRCKLDGGPWTACSGAGSQAYSGLSDGDHKFSVRATDSAGNVETSPPERNWYVDVTPPQTSILSGPSGVVRKTDASFELKADDAAATFECSIDGDAFAACISPQAYAGLTSGAHTFAVRAVDDIGNVDATPATRSWTVDTSQELPPRGQDPRRKKRCTFEEDLARCGRPYMRARAIATSPGTGRAGFGKVKMKANGGGAPLGAVVFKPAPGLTMHALDEGEIGDLELFGFKKSRTVPITTAGPGLGGADGKPTVRIAPAGRRVKITDLPAKVRRVRLVLDGPSLRVESIACVTRTWTAKLWDWKGFTTTVKTAADVRCPKGAGR